MSLEDQKAAFDLLGLPMTADEDTIRRAWRKLARTYHPDLAKEDRDAANQRLAEINAAFDLLSAGHVEERRKAREAVEAAQRARAEAELRAQLRAEAAARAQAKAEADQEEAARQAEAKAEAETPDQTACAPPPFVLPFFYTERRENLRARRAFDAALRSVQDQKAASDKTTYA
jgi:curved DNA-binding protein CbpA